MFDMISNTAVPSKIANKWKFATVFEKENGERFTSYRNNEEDVKKDITFFGHDKFMSMAIRN